jgi:hypothetical protein
MSRRYTVYAPPGGTIMRIDDGATPYLNSLAVRFPNFTDRAMRHMAWWLRGIVKTEMRASAPAGQRWPKTAQITKYRVLETFKKSYKAGDSTRGKFGDPKQESGRLINAVGYSHPSMLNVRVGWLSRSAAKMGVIFQGGQQTKITNKMRMLFMAAGVPLAAGKRMINQPPRPVFEPIFKARREQIGEIIETRVAKHLDDLASSYRVRAVA